MRFPNVRRAFVVLAASAGLLLAGGAATQAAFASDNANVAGLFSNGTPNSTVNDTCGGANNTNPALAVGFVNYHLDGNQLTAVIHLKGATPNTTYFLDLWEGFCQAVHLPNAGQPTSVVTNGNGVGNAVVTFTVNNPALGGTYWVFMDSFTSAGFVLANGIAVNP